jgi:hypothetical protein
MKQYSLQMCKQFVSLLQKSILGLPLGINLTKNFFCKIDHFILIIQITVQYRNGPAYLNVSRFTKKLVSALGIDIEAQK